MKLRRSKPSPTLARPRRNVAYPQRTAPVFSYYSGQRRPTSSSDNLQSPTKDQRRLDSVKVRRMPWPRFQFKHIPTYVALFALVVALGYTMSLSASPRIVIEQHPGVVQRSISEYEPAIYELWRSSLLNRTKLTIDTTQTRDAILGRYHELGDVRVQLPLVGHRATIVLVPAAPLLQIEAQNGTFYLDAEGKALADTSHVSTSDRVPVVQDESVVSVAPGQPVLPPSQMLFILQLVTELDAVRVPITSLTLSDNVVNQLELRTSEHPYYVKFQVDGSIDVQQTVGTYLAARKKLAVDGMRPGEYLDLRVPEKVFYR